MARKEISNLWDRDMRIAIDQNFKELYNEYTQAGLNAADAREKAVQAVAESLTANLIADEAKSIAERVSTELGQAILEGDSSPLGGQLSVGSDGTVYNDPQDRFVKEMNSVNQQLAENAKGLYSSSKRGVVKNREVKPTITIIDDDSRRELYDVMFPVIKERGIPISSAVISSRVGNYSNVITTEELIEMRDSGLVEFVNHTHNHLHLADLTEEEIRYEIETCEKFLESYGIFSKHLVYPFGSFNAQVKEIASDYVNSASKFFPVEIINPNNLFDSFDLRRITFESDLEEIKTLIDEAISVNGWLIINTHSQYTSFNTDKLNEIITYALANSVEFVPVSEGYKRFGNLVELKDGNEHIGTITATGEKHGIFKVEDNPEYIFGGTVNQSDLPDVYPNRKISTTNFTNANATAGGWELGAGVLFTDRRGNDDYTYQLYHPLNSTEVYKRTWNFSTLKWCEFRNVNGISDSVVLGVGSYTLEPGASRNITLTSDVFKRNTVILGNPITTSINNGIVYNIYPSPSSDGSATLKVHNIRNASATLTEGDWIFKTIY